MCSFFFFFWPTDRPTFTRGRAMGNGTFYGDGLSRNCLSVGCNSISEFHIIGLNHEILYQTKCTRKLNLYKYEIARAREVWRHVTMEAKFLNLDNLSWRGQSFALSNDERIVWTTVLFLSAIIYSKVIHVNFFVFFFCYIWRTTVCWNPW